jgi:hypothetical protein
MYREVVIAHPPSGTRAEPVTRVRSTFIAAGIAVLRTRGLFDRYANALSDADRPALLSTVAGSWVSLALAMAHYRACDALELPHFDAMSIGAEVGARAHDSVLLGVKHLALATGVTPWTLVAQYDRLWARSFEGGGFRILRAGPKDAIIEVHQSPLAASPYYRSTFCGVNLAALNLMTKKAFVRVLPTWGALSFSVRASWV